MEFINATTFPATLVRTKLLYRDLMMATVVQKCAFVVRNDGTVHREEQQLEIAEGMVDSGTAGGRVSQIAAGGGAGGDASGSKNSVGGATAQDGSSVGRTAWPESVDAGAAAARDATVERVLPVEATVVDATLQVDGDASEDRETLLIWGCVDICTKLYNLDCNPYSNNLTECDVMCRSVWDYLWDECHDIVPATLKCRLAAPDSYSYSCNGDEVVNRDTVCEAQAHALSECVDKP